MIFATSLLRLTRCHRLSAAALLCACAGAQAETWVITDYAHPVVNSGSARVILLDEQQRLEDHLTSRLPADPSKAREAIQAYLSSAEGMQFQHRLASAQQGATDAWSIGVEKVPAVVVDRGHVVYGESDVDQAVRRIRTFRSETR